MVKKKNTDWMLNIRPTCQRMLKMMQSRNMLVAVEFYIFFFNFSNLNSTIKDSSFASQKDDLGLHKASASCSGNMETWKGNLLEQLEYEHYVCWPLNRVVQNPIFECFQFFPNYDLEDKITYQI